MIQQLFFSALFLGSALGAPLPGSELEKRFSAAVKTTTYNDTQGFSWTCMSNTVFSGYLISSLPATDYNSCQLSCNALPNCATVVYESNSNKCYLRELDYVTLAQANGGFQVVTLAPSGWSTVSGIKHLLTYNDLRNPNDYSDQPMYTKKNTYTVQQNVNYTGTVISKLTCQTMTFQDCVNSCDGTTNCATAMLITSGPNKNQCILRRLGAQDQTALSGGMQIYTNNGVGSSSSAYPNTVFAPVNGDTLGAIVTSNNVQSQTITLYTGSTYIVNPQTVYGSSLITSITAQTLNGCLQLCEDTASCTNVAFYTNSQDTRNCALYSKGSIATGQNMSTGQGFGAVRTTTGSSTTTTVNSRRSEYKPVNLLEHQRLHLSERGTVMFSC